MEAVEAGRHEEGRAIKARIFSPLSTKEVFVLQDMVVLIGLNGGEHRAQDNGQDQADPGTLAVASLQGMVRPSYGGT